MAVKALVVDDQPVIRDVLRLRLERLGCTVAEAENASQGLETFRNFMPDLVTLDIVMPVIAGYTALHLLRDIRKISANTDVVVVSSKAQERDEFLREGAIEFIVKPFDNFARLMRKLEPLIQTLSAEGALTCDRSRAGK
jgi:two-component system, chemotaxis family, chemotaxis protein CheY